MPSASETMPIVFAVNWPAQDPIVGRQARSSVSSSSAVILPVMTALVYIVARGRGMAERARAAAQRAKSDADAYIREVAGKSPADQIAQAKALLDAGTINADEFARLKAKALA